MRLRRRHVAGGAPAALFEAVQIHDAYARNTAFAAPIMAAAADLARLIPHHSTELCFFLSFRNSTARESGRTKHIV